MFVARIDAHATYSVIAIVSNAGQLVEGPVRIMNREANRLVARHHQRVRGYVRTLDSGEPDMC